MTLCIIGLADFCNAICVSLQAPFFPNEVGGHVYKNFPISKLKSKELKLHKNIVFFLLAKIDSDPDSLKKVAELMMMKSRKILSSLPFP